MESNNDFPQITETLVLGSSGSGVFYLEKNDQIQSIPPASTEELISIEQCRDCTMDDSQDSVGDSMVCDSTSRLVMTGFSRSCCTDDIVRFVNAGCEDTSRPDPGVEFSADSQFQGGDVLRTDECISDGGDYPFIYQSARFGNFSYQFRDLPSGDYLVDLHFAEIINTYGPKGMRLFNVYNQNEKVLSDFDIFAVVGANKPLLLVDFRTYVKDDGLLLMRFECLLGTAVVSGICIRRAPKLGDSQLANEFLQCNHCAGEIEPPVAQAQEKGMRLKLTAKYEKKNDELSQQCQRKTDDCYQAWMSLTVATEQLEKVRMELDNKLFQTYSLV